MTRIMPSKGAQDLRSFQGTIAGTGLADSETPSAAALQAARTLRTAENRERSSTVRSCRYVQSYGVVWTLTASNWT